MSEEQREQREQQQHDEIGIINVLQDVQSKYYRRKFVMYEFIFHCFLLIYTYNF